MVFVTGSKLESPERRNLKESDPVSLLYSHIWGGIFFIYLIWEGPDLPKGWADGP